MSSRNKIIQPANRHVWLKRKKKNTFPAFHCSISCQKSLISLIIHDFRFFIYHQSFLTIFDLCLYVCNKLLILFPNKGKILIKVFVNEIQKSVYEFGGGLVGYTQQSIWGIPVLFFSLHITPFSHLLTLSRENETEIRTNQFNLKLVWFSVCTLNEEKWNCFSFGAWIGLVPSMMETY